MKRDFSRLVPEIFWRKSSWVGGTVEQVEDRVRMKVTFWTEIVG